MSCFRAFTTTALLFVGTTFPGLSGRAQQAPSQSFATPPAEQAGSSVRIVRLSLARGVVTMDRYTGKGFEPAFANIPVVSGARLRTGQGVAEVEFEDNSSLRLGPASEVSFEQLSRSANGATETAVRVERGLVYVGLEKTKGNMFAVLQGPARLLLSPGAHLRLDATGAQTQLALFDGGAAVQMGSATAVLSKRQSMVLDPTAETLSLVSKGTTEGTLDVWDKQENDFHKQKAAFAPATGVGQYGANDLNYYGSFADLPGCGNVWRPYFASTAWDPFANGTWAWDPSAGYSWVSPYPWGWLPFHSGSWASCGTGGWGWRPGANWYGLNNQQALKLPGHKLPYEPPRAPQNGASTLVAVSTRPLPRSGLGTTEDFTFRRDSAGLGVPRATFGNLRSTSTAMERHDLETRGVSISNLPVARIAGYGLVTSGQGARGTGVPVAGRGVASGTTPSRNAGGLSAGSSGAMRSSSLPASSGTSLGSAPAASGGGRH